MSTPGHLYAANLNRIEWLAVRELEDWWSGHNRMDRPPEELLDLMREPFTEMVDRYGALAANTAVDYLITNRSLDQELRWLPTPTPAEKATYRQAYNSLRWAINSTTGDGFQDAQRTFRRITGVLNRLVLLPARETVHQATRKAGTYFARVPEPGACEFCLMLASRGAVYTRDTVMGKDQMSKYHDHCRCLGIEATGATLEQRWAQLPPINRELHDLWHEEIAGAQGLGAGGRRAAWRNLIIYHRRRRTGSDDPVRFPPIAGVTTPKYTSRARRDVFGSREPLPDLEKMPGHVLFGWVDDDPLPPLGDEPPPKDGKIHHGRLAHTRALRQGHRHGSTRPGATVFPPSWSDQKIIDAVRDTIEDPDEYLPAGPANPQRVVRKRVDGVTIQVEWIRRPDGTSRFHSAYPIDGDGVTEVDKNGASRPVASTREKRSKFRPVE